MKTMNFVKLVGKAINVLPRDGYIFFHAEIDRDYVPCLWKSKHLGNGKRRGRSPWDAPGCLWTLCAIGFYAIGTIPAWTQS